MYKKCTMARIGKQIVSVNFYSTVSPSDRHFWMGGAVCFAISILVLGLFFWEKVYFLWSGNIIISLNYLLPPFFYRSAEPDGIMAELFSVSLSCTYSDWWRNLFTVAWMSLAYPFLWPRSEPSYGHLVYLRTLCRDTAWHIINCLLACCLLDRRAESVLDTCLDWPPMFALNERLGWCSSANVWGRIAITKPRSLAKFNGDWRCLWIWLL